jgi:enolase
MSTSIIQGFREKENIIDIYDWMVVDKSLTNFRENVFAVRNTFNELKSIDKVYLKKI